MENKKDIISEKQIEFMLFWETVIMKNKSNITSTMMDTCSSLTGMRRTGSCSTCLRNDLTELKNKYNLLLPVYKEHMEKIDTKIVETKETKVEVEPIITKKKRVYKKKKK